MLTGQPGGAWAGLTGRKRLPFFLKQGGTHMLKLTEMIQLGAAGFKPADIKKFGESGIESKDIIELAKSGYTANDVDELIKEADTKMYENKANFYENEMVGIES